MGISGDVGEILSTVVHGVGASMLFVGSIVFELQCLYCSPVPRFTGNEKMVRTAMLIACGICCIVWVGSSAATKGSSAPCCKDEWRIPTMEDLKIVMNSSHPYTAIMTAEAFEKQKPLLVNS